MRVFISGLTPEKRKSATELVLSYGPCAAFQVGSAIKNAVPCPTVLSTVSLCPWLGRSHDRLTGQAPYRHRPPSS